MDPNLRVRQSKANPIEANVLLNSPQVENGKNSFPASASLIADTQNKADKAKETLYKMPNTLKPTKAVHQQI